MPYSRGLFLDGREHPQEMYLTLLILATAILGTLASSRIPLRFTFPKGLLISVFEWFGELGIFCMRLFRAAMVPPYEFGELVRQCDEIGSKSLPLVALAGAATGVVLSLETRDSLVRFGAKSFLPAVIVFSIIKESGPIITGLIVSGRVGAGIGAQLGSMRVTEQIDAMEASAVDPYKFLVATRVLACILMLPLLTLAADFCGIFMGWIANCWLSPFHCTCFWRTVSRTCCLATSFRRRLRQRFSASSSDLFHAFRECERGEAQKAWDARPRALSCSRHCLSCWPTWCWYG